MKQLILICFLFVSSYAVSRAQQLQWVSTFGSQDNDFVTAIAADAQGNAYVTGNFRKTIKFPAELGFPDLSYNGVLNSFIAKYNPNGTLEWAKKLGESNSEYALVHSMSVAVDKEGAFYVAGEFQDKIDFDLGAGVSVLNSYESGNMFLAKYDAAGEYVWAISFGKGTVYDIAIDADKNVVVSGGFSQTADFNPGSENYTLINKGEMDAFVAKFDDNGNLKWAHGFGGTGHDKAWALSVSPNAIYVGGAFSGTMVVSSNTEDNIAITSKGEEDALILKLDHEGNFGWNIAFGDYGYDNVSELCTDAEGNIYAIGTYQGSIALNTSTEGLLTSNGGYDIYVAKYSPSGELAWGYGLGGTANDHGKAAAVSPHGSLVVTGGFGGNVRLDIGGEETTFTSAGSVDALMASFSLGGQLEWAKAIGGSSVDDGEGVAVDGWGDIYLAGRYATTFNFEKQNTESKVTSNGLNDFFIAKYSATGVTAVPSQAPEGLISVYPNPTEGVVCVEIPKETQQAKISVTDLKGQQYAPAVDRRDNKLSVDMHRFKSGLYIISLETETFHTVKKVFVK